MDAPVQTDFSKVDWTQYPSWEKVTTDSGGVVYVVPGTGWVYDPFTSAQTGQVQLFKNPKPAQDAKKKEQDAIKKATSPAMQAVPVVTGVGAAVAAPWLLDKAMGAKAVGTVKLPNGKVGVTWNDGTIKTPDGQLINSSGEVSTGLTPANSTPLSPTSDAFSQGAVSAPIASPVANPVQIGVNADGTPIYQTLSPSDVAAPAAPAPGTNWGAIAQGVGGGLQVIGGVNQWKQGDKFGGALSTGAGLANIGAASGLESVAPWAAPLTAGAGLWGTWKGMEASNAKASAFGGAQAGAGIGAMVGGPVGAVIGAPIGALAGAALGHIGGAKSAVQQQRDDIRKGFQALNISDKDHNVTLADGSTYNIGLDGHAMLANVGSNLDGKTERHPYDVDFSNPLAVSAIPTIKTIAMQMLGEKASQKQIDDTTGMLVNAITSNAKTQADVNANISALQSRTGGGQQQQAPQPAQPQITPPTSPNPQIGNQGPVLNNTKPPTGPPKNSNINGSKMTNQQLGRSLAKRMNQRVG